MVTTDDILAEVAEAEAAGLKAEELNQLRGMVEGSQELPSGIVYEVPDSDKAAWIAAYRLSIDHAGVERGEPAKLAKGALGMYLAKRRPVDGGRLFTLKMPEHMVAPPTFQCFAAPNYCQAKYDTKMNLIDHMEAAHPRESKHFAKQIEMVRESANKENPALQALVEQMAATPDPGTVVVPESLREAHNANVPDVTPEDAVEVSLVNRCMLCSWPQGSTRWAHEPPTQQALKMHILSKHKDEVD